MARALIGPGGSGLDELEHETGRAFDVVGRLDVERDHFEVVAEGTLAEIGAEAPPCAAGDELNLPILEPHRFVETDAVSRLSAGYEVQVIGGLPYVGTQQRMRIERATRFAAQAALLDVEPARPVAPSAPPRVAEDGEVEDKVSDILEPERRVGERTDVEGRVRRQKRRTQAEQRRERGKSGGGSGGGKSGGGRDSSRSKTADKAADRPMPTPRASPTARTTRCARARTARPPPRSAAGAVAAAVAAAAAAARARARTARPRTARPRSLPNGAAAEPAAAAATASERPPRAPGEARPRQRRRRSGSGSGGGSGGGANGSADAGRAEREPAPAATPAASAPPPSRLAEREPSARDAAAASEDERRKGLISRILGR